MRALLRSAALVLLAALPVSAQVRGYIPRVSLGGTMGVGGAAPSWRGGLTGSPLTGGLSNPHGLVPTLAPTLPAAALAPANLAASVIAAPSLAPAAPVALAAPAAFAAPAAPASVISPAAASLSAPADAPERAAGAPAALDTLRSLSAPADGPRWVRAGNGFDGLRGRAETVAGPSQQAGPAGFIKNPDGVWVGGRVKDQTIWISQMAEQLKPHADLTDVLDVMDDAYDEARVKLVNAERAAAERQLDAASVHLEGTRNWVDAVLTDRDGEQIAVHTHRVYFHPGRGNKVSEITEGIRRVGKYIDKAVPDFAPGGLAETDMDARFKQVELNFDTRGYKEIEDYIRGREAEVKAKYGDRFAFRYTTEPKRSSQRLRAEYNAIVERFADQTEGLMQIIDGVTYSRTVGVGHELNSHLKRISMGYTITQAGRDFFGKTVLPDGTIVETYKTEFDAVTERRGAKGEREVILWEDKSTRVWLPLEDTMEQTFLYKLRIYRENRDLIEKELGAPLKVAFSVDVGGLNRKAAKLGFLVWKDPRQQELLEHLKTAGPRLSEEFGFPVSFMFVNSHPGESADLFYRTPMSQEEWAARGAQLTKQQGKKQRREERRRNRRH
jgi:hypothetical protein